MPENIIRDRDLTKEAISPSPGDVLELSLNVRMRNYRGTHFISFEGRVFELNPAGWSILMAIDGVKSVHDIACSVSQEYGIPLGDALGEIIDFVFELSSCGVVLSETVAGKAREER